MVMNIDELLQTGAKLFSKSNLSRDALLESIGGIEGALGCAKKLFGK